MNVVRVGIALRALRRRKGWRQLDLAHACGLSEASISRLERGDAGAVTLAALERVIVRVGADLDVVVRWRGGALDRLLDADHARLVGIIARRLAALGFDVRPELSYSEFGERGSIDLLAIDLRARVLIVVEVKTDVVSLEATLRKHDEKVRLAPAIVGGRLGRRGPWTVVPLLVLPDTGAARRRVSDHADVLDRAYPLRGRSLWSQLASRQLAQRQGGILFLPLIHRASGGSPVAAPHRVRRPPPSVR